jgi:opacity protein-like surface antigen
MKLLISFLFASTLFVSIKGNAASGGHIYLEPGVNYNLAKTYKITEAMGIEVPESDAWQGTIDGLEINLRGGWNVSDKFFVGLDLNNSMADMKSKDGSSTMTGSLMTYGLNLGYKFVPAFKAWFTYYLGGSGAYKDKDDSSVEYKPTTISAMKLGVGYAVVEYVSINFEYWMSGSLKGDLSSTGVTLNDTKAEFSGANVSVSFPFNF